MFVLLAVVCGCALLGHVTDTAHVYQEYLLYDFYSKLPADRVAAHFRDVHVIKSHKVFGVGRYFFLVQDDNSAALYRLTLPHDAYNERVFPVQHVFALFSHFHATPSTIDLPYLPDGNLTFAERTWHKSMSYDEMSATISAYAKGVVAHYASGPSGVHVFVPCGKLPVKFFFFMTMPTHDTTALFLRGSKLLGGPGAIETSILDIFNIA